MESKTPMAGNKSLSLNGKGGKVLLDPINRTP